MRVTFNAIHMGNGLTLTMDDAGSTVNGLALLDVAGEPLGMEASALVVRQGIYDRDIPAGEETAGTFLDTNGDIVIGQSIYIAPPGTTGSARKTDGARFVFDETNQDLRIDVPGRVGAMRISSQGVTFDGSQNNVVTNYVSTGGFFDRETGTAPGAKIDVDGGSAHVGGGVFVCPAGTAAALRAQVGVESSAGNDALLVRAGGQIGATVRSTGLAAPSVSVGEAESVVVTADATSLRVAVDGVADALVATADRVVGPAFADRETGTAAGAKIDVDGGSAHVGGGVFVCPAGTEAALRAQVGVESSAGNDALLVRAGGQAVAEVTAAGDMGATRFLFGGTRNGALAANATSISMEVNADPTSRLTLRAGGIQVGGIDSGPFRVIPAGTELENIVGDVEFTAGVGCIGPVYRESSWSGLYAFEGTAYWDHVDGADPLVLFSADTNIKTADHFQMQRYRVKIAIDSPLNLLRIFGGPAEVSVSAAASEAFVAGERYEIPFTFNAGTGDVSASVVRVSTGVSVASLTAKAGSWPAHTALYLFLCNDNDVSTNLTGISSLRVLAGVPHVAFRYPVLFLPASTNAPLAGIVPGVGGVQEVSDVYEAGLGLVAQLPGPTEFQAWNSWVQAQNNLSLSPGAGFSSYPVVGGLTETTLATDASTLVGAPFWVHFVPVTVGGTGAMDGSSFGDAQGFYSRSSLSRVSQHALPSAGDYLRSAQRGTRVLLLLQNEGLNEPFTSVDRNGFVSGARSNGSRFSCIATWFLTEAGLAEIHWTSSALGEVPGTTFDTDVGTA